MTARDELFNYIKRVNALAEVGLVYATTPYETERYEELTDIARRMMAVVGRVGIEELLDGVFINEREYKTPQVDVRAVVFNDEGRLLLVQEKADGCWSLPGGWADVGYTASEVAVKEVREETGYEVEPVEVIAVLDKKCHPHPPQPHYSYKIFFGCRLLGGRMRPSFDTLDARFFGEDEIPELSEIRVTLSQIQMIFDRRHTGNANTIFD